MKGMVRVDSSTPPTMVASFSVSMICMTMRGAPHVPYENADRG